MAYVDITVSLADVPDTRIGVWVRRIFPGNPDLLALRLKSEGEYCGARYVEPQAVNLHVSRGQLERLYATIGEFLAEEGGGEPQEAVIIPVIDETIPAMAAE